MHAKFLESSHCIKMGYCTNQLKMTSPNVTYELY